MEQRVPSLHFYGNGFWPVCASIIVLNRLLKNWMMASISERVANYEYIPELIYTVEGTSN